MDEMIYDMLVNQAKALVIRKGEDYNQSVDLHDYFPFGDMSYVQMLHMKVTRLRSLIAVTANGGEPNFDSVLDTTLDLLNYTVFYLDYLKQVDQ